MKVNRVKIIWLPVCCVFLLQVFGSCSSSGETTWETLTDGLELKTFVVTVSGAGNQAQLVVLRVDPLKLQLELEARSEQGGANDKTAKQWRRQMSKKGNAAGEIVAVTNAGMFNIDHSSHIGYMKVRDHINNPHILRQKYYSAALFGPLEEGLPEFQIADLDEVSLDSLKSNYRYVIQNLRLIKYPGENRWEEQDRKWSEIALAEDNEGNALFIFVRQPLTMFNFNEIVLALPLDIVRAQHLEGGPEAQLFYQAGERKNELVGSYETGFSDFSNRNAWPIPNVIVVRRIQDGL